MNSFDGELQEHEALLRELVGTEPRRLGGGHGVAIVVDALAKRYPNGTEAVRGISFRVRSGEVFGILGPNGAGKSTTIETLGTLVLPTGGRATVAGLDIVAQCREVRRRIGFAMQAVGVDDLATGRELLILHGRLHGLSRGEAARRAALLLALVGLGDHAGARMVDYSLGSG
jgi:ABC-2 type transport system ATP-binding protein